jgi:formylmethanofuran dehydrogenase subunit E-like metal-binding protein
VLDAQGRLVGLAFDGNWESISDSWLFRQETARTIMVDVRYMLWVMDKVDHSERLLREVGVP